MSLFDYGFDTYECVDLAASGEIQCTLPIIGGDAEAVTLTNAQSLRVCVKKNRGSIVQRIELNRLRFAPSMRENRWDASFFCWTASKLPAPIWKRRNILEKRNSPAGFQNFKNFFKQDNHGTNQTSKVFHRL